MKPLRRDEVVADQASHASKALALADLRMAYVECACAKAIKNGTPEHEAEKALHNELAAHVADLTTVAEKYGLAAMSFSKCRKVNYTLYGVNCTHPAINSKRVADSMEELNTASLLFTLAEDALAKRDMARYLSELAPAAAAAAAATAASAKAADDADKEEVETRLEGYTTAHAALEALLLLEVEGGGGDSVSELQYTKAAHYYIFAEVEASVEAKAAASAEAKAAAAAAAEAEAKAKAEAEAKAKAEAEAEAKAKAEAEAEAEAEPQAKRACCFGRTGSA
jgi:hypothetical protein